jgi:tetratricopeptide (TPR) repeat protein
MRKALLAAAAMFATCAYAQTSTLADKPLLGVGICGDLKGGAGHYGPYDYRKHPEKSPLVEQFHFTPQVEALTAGKSTAKLGGDIGYTLRAFPNHPRALYAMTRYSQLLGGVSRVPGARFPVECYFDRAVRFAPDDAQVRALYADYLLRLNRNEDARKQLEVAATLELNPQIEYNLALAWAKLGENEKALELAKRAYAGGVQFPGLRDQLTRAGVWK